MARTNTKAVAKKRATKRKVVKKKLPVLTFYKVVRNGGLSPYATDRNGNYFEYKMPVGGKPGRWMTTKGSLDPCANGFHVCREYDIHYWCGPEAREIYVAEVRGDRIDSDRKIVFRDMRLVKLVGICTPSLYDKARYDQRGFLKKAETILKRRKTKQ